MILFDLIDPVLFTGFLLSLFAVVLSPGPDSLLMLRYSLSYGLKHGLACVLGVQLGVCIHALFSIVGLSAIIHASPLLFKGIALLGSLYLVWLGFQSIRQGALTLSDNKLSKNPIKACAEAILTNLLNPKALLFFIAFVPQFIDLERGHHTLQFSFMFMVIITTNTVWQTIWVLMAGQIRKWMTNPKVQKWVNMTMGAIFMGLGIMMAVNHLF